ncbi:hypothetical protein EDB81DRAFT_808415 [Dactylonectria macrodidyma]|uniref:Uncharacterized protein n=1 Tax=Dactylonectria macrodidyma TaxID=307937 RepID=A0A9P9E1E6_9HYPO|nr:hypothetical protein EDB81DRAFT_808415 [Dactylonectria macrodidyma]
MSRNPPRFTMPKIPSPTKILPCLAMTETRRRYACRVCPRTYTQACHLRRHERTHADEPEFKCPFCHDGFTRSDAARRHSKTCTGGSGRPLPSAPKPGRKYHACDCCAMSKSGCDARLPCSSCRARKQPCTYNRVLQSLATGRPSTSTSGSLVVASSSCAGRDPRADARLAAWAAVEIDSSHDSSQREPSDAVLVTFLLQYTNPRNGSIQDYFISPSLTDKASAFQGDGNGPAIVQDDNRDSGAVQPWLCADPGSGGDSDEGAQALHIICEADFLVVLDQILDAPWQGPARQTRPESSLGQLQTTLSEISSALCAIDNMDRLSFTAYSLLIEAVGFVFAPQRARSFVESYFTSWHPHCPILHPTSFDLAHASPPLLAAVILMGASFSSRKAVTAARVCLDAAEEYIFGHQGFVQLIDPDRRGKSSTDLALLQAAFIIILVQLWGNHGASWRQIRQHRYPGIIQAARSMGLPSLRHKEVCHQPGIAVGGESWETFLETEESIRLMAFIFLVDSSQAVFHRARPLLALSELTGSFPCSEKIFAGQPAEGQDYHGPKERFYKIPSIADGVSLLMANSWTNHTPFRFGQLSYLDLFILISGLHEIIFSSYDAHSLERSKTALRRALKRWKHLWNLNVKKIADLENDCHGFFRKADEFWWLGNILLHEDSPLPSKTGEPANGDYMDNMHDFLRQFDRLSVKSP